MLHRAGIFLTEREAVILAVLMANDIASRAAIMAELYPNRVAPPAAKIVHVFVCRLRAKLARVGVGITTVHRRGYVISPAGKQTIRDILNPQAGAA